MDLSGKVAVVTGGAQGIGRATADLMAERGASVVLADIEQSTLDATVGELSAKGCRVLGVRTDVASYESMEALRDATVEAFGAIDVVFLNAGVITPPNPTPLWEVELDDWRWVVDVNVWGVINGIRALVPPIVAGGRPGHVVITSSSVGVIAPSPSSAVYAMTKASVCSLAEALHGSFRTRELPIGASVLVPPGAINTGLFSATRNRPADLGGPASSPSSTYEEILERMNKAGNPRRPIEPAEVAAYVVDAIESGAFWVLPDHRHPDARDNFHAIAQARVDSMINRTDPTTYMQKSL